MSEFKIERTVMNKSELQKTIRRIASQIIEGHKNSEDLLVVGLKTRGEFIAKRLIKVLKETEDCKIEMGVLDATLFRDDFRMNLKVPSFSINDMPFSVDEKKIVLVDDVVFTGRSIFAALNALMDRGRPKIIRFAALIDRGLREIPISPDYFGEVVQTQPDEEIRVKLSEVDEEDAVYLVKMN